MCVSDSQTRSKPIKKIALKIAFFDLNFTCRSPKSHKNPGVGKQNWLTFDLPAGFQILRIQDPESWKFKNCQFFGISGFQILDCQDFEEQIIVFLLKFKILKKRQPFLFSIEWDFLESQNFERKKSVFPLDSSLNFSSKAGEKSYFAFWLDFDQQYFADRESILKRQFCVVEQYSNFSQQKGEDGKSVKITQRL